MTKRKTITLQVYSLCQGVQCKFQVSIHKLLQYTKYISHYAIYQSQYHNAIYQSQYSEFTQALLIS